MGKWVFEFNISLLLNVHIVFKSLLKLGFDDKDDEDDEDDEDEEDDDDDEEDDDDDDEASLLSKIPLLQRGSINEAETETAWP